MSTSSGNARIWGLVVTFRRPALLAEMLQQIQLQTRTPDTVIVVDNGSEEAVRNSVLSAGAVYVDAGGNLGPAGGIALGMQRILADADDDDWIVVFDDDDPPDSEGVLERLFDLARERISVDPATAAVGNVGARYDRRRGIFLRVPDDELVGPVLVDYIGGGQIPLYSCRAVMSVGEVDGSLFFGFDDADFGLKLRAAGYKLWIDGAAWRARREYLGRLNLGERRRSLKPMPAWRRYYSLRNAIILAKRYAAPATPLFVAAVGTGRGIASLMRHRSPARDYLLPLRACIDGLMGRTGRIIDPVSGASPPEQTPG